MADEENKFTHIGIERKTQRQIAILAKIHGVTIYDLVGTWTDDAWEKARRAGLVTDAMLGAHWVGAATSREDGDGKKLLEAVKGFPTMKTSKSSTTLRRGSGQAPGTKEHEGKEKAVKA